MVEIYKNMFHDKFYLEMMLLDFKKQKPYDVFIMKAAERYGLPLIITNDCHVCLKEDMKMQSIMLMMQMGKTMKQVEQKLVEDGDVFEIQDQNLWMKSEEEINEKWLSDYQDVMDYDIFKQAKQNTVKICELAKGVEFQIDRTIKFPSFENDDQKLLDAIKQGFEFKKIPKTKQYFNRIKEEYELIKEKGFCSYFLVQKMITDEARRVSPLILGWGDGSEAVGPGRGSIGGSLVAYALGLIDVDPIKHDLLFSRFLSPARGGKSMKIRFSSDPIKKLSANIDVIKNGSTEECPFS